LENNTRGSKQGREVVIKDVVVDGAKGSRKQESRSMILFVILLRCLRSVRATPCFRYDRKVRDWAIVRQLIFIEWRNDRFFENGAKLTRGDREFNMLMIVGTRLDVYLLRSQVGIGSYTDCLLGQAES